MSEQQTYEFGGIIYEVIDKEPKVGDEIVVTDLTGNIYREGEVFDVGFIGILKMQADEGDWQVDFNNEHNRYVDEDGTWHVGEFEGVEFVVVRPQQNEEPAPTRFTFDGVEYGIVDRKPVVGDYVVVTEYNCYGLTITKPLLRTIDFKYSDGAWGISEGIPVKKDLIDGDILNEIDNFYVVEPLVQAQENPLDSLPQGSVAMWDDGVTQPAAATQATRITATCDEVRDLLIRKNHDYGDSFSKQFDKYGLMSALIRMDDKMARLDTLINADETMVDESIEDTLADLAGYALLALVEMRKGRE